MDKKKFSLSQWLHILLGIGGAILLFWMVKKIGFDVLKENLMGFGLSKTLFLFLLYTLAQLSFCAAWFYVIIDPEKKLTLWRLFIAYLAGDAINMTVPSANLAGEPVKVLLVKDKISVQSAVASVTVYKISDFFSMTLFLFFGWALHFFFFDLPLSWKIGGGIVSLGMVLISLLLLLVQERGLYLPITNVLHKIGLGDWFLKKMESAHLIDQDIRNFFDKEGKKFCISLFFNFLAWFGGVLEIWIFTKMMGYEIGFFQALTIETFSLFINNVLFFVPARIGVIEGGRVLLFAALGFPSSCGLTYGIIRRIRELAWIGIGLVVLIFKKTKN